jgi:hypothetical protein
MNWFTSGTLRAHRRRVDSSQSRFSLRVARVRSRNRSGNPDGIERGSEHPIRAMKRAPTGRGAGVDSRQHAEGGRAENRLRRCGDGSRIEWAEKGPRSTRRAGEAAPPRIRRELEAKSRREGRQTTEVRCRWALASLATSNRPRYGLRVSPLHGEGCGRSKAPGEALVAKSAAKGRGKRAISRESPRERFSSGSFRGAPETCGKRRP